MSATPTAQLEPVAAKESAPRTILVIDDDETQVAALEHRLKNLGFRVLSAFRGRAALQIAFEQTPDLILLDLRLPDIEGFDVCAELADDPATCGIPIIILSAMERHDIVRRSRSVGCDYYLRKPYDPNVLLALIEKSLRESSEYDW